MDRFEKVDRTTHTHHCWHQTTTPLMISLKDGYVHQTCCECLETRTVHRDHTGTWERVR